MRKTKLMRKVWCLLKSVDKLQKERKTGALSQHSDFHQLYSATTDKSHCAR